MIKNVCDFYAVLLNSKVIDQVYYIHQLNLHDSDLACSHLFHRDLWISTVCRKTDPTVIRIIYISKLNAVIYNNVINHLQKTIYVTLN